MCGFGDELHAGLEEELKKKTRMEIFRQLKFVAKTSAKGTKKIVARKTKQHLAKMLIKKKKKVECVFDGFCDRPQLCGPSPLPGVGVPYCGGFIILCWPPRGGYPTWLPKTLRSHGF